ncbi:pentatricopeptide repeat-containing protein At2g13600-like isoform X1 [Typha angustifolia]|uniref:pentatricopeptide repeat-containing protein At2g13600-like isoform X1 n=1 Tax=Typha angustifolia TaxID=59011 RepID=UPI003C2AAE77
MLDKMPYPRITTAKAITSSPCRAILAVKSQAIFSGTKNERNPDGLSAMISRCARDGYHSEGLQLFRKFQRWTFDPDEFVLSNVLSISANLLALDEGKQIHAFIVKKNLPFDVAASNALINFYVKCGNMGDAERVFFNMSERDVYSWTVMVSGYAGNGCLENAMDWFNKMPCRNLVSWNAIINGYQRDGCDEMALELFHKMRVQGEVPNKMTFLAVLKACTCLQQLENGQELHGFLVKSGWLKSIFVQCTLMDLYGKSGDLLDVEKAFGEITEHNVVSCSILMAAYAQNGKILEAEQIFNGMQERNVMSWNVMISGCVQKRMKDKALGLFVHMIKEGTSPNCFTFTSLLTGCSEKQYTRNGKIVHAYVMKQGLQSDTSIGNSLITMYGEQGNIKDACLVFDMMPLHDVISWTALVAAYVSNDDINEASHTFDRMPEKNLISWNTMMFGYLQNDKSLENGFMFGMNNLSALTFFYEMEQSEIKPDCFSYNCALSACASVGALEQASVIHCRTVKRGFESDLGVGNALISVYGKCGGLNEAERVFKSINSPDMITWNALLTGYSHNGQGNQVLSFYKKMRESGLGPNHVTFISLLSACSHMGEVKRGQEFFEEMKDFGIVPTKEHYACMVDLLGRAGHLHEAEAIIRCMPMEPDIVVWGALLGACKIHGNHVIGRIAAEHIFHLEPYNSSAHVALAKTYAAAGIWEDVAQVRAIVRAKKLMKDPGWSCIEIRCQKHRFLSADREHLLMNSIYATLWNIYANMFEGGERHSHSF